MNIFVLDSLPHVSARYHCDKHVHKMIVESAQMLSSAHRTIDFETDFHNSIYAQVRTNHPATAWVRETEGNYLWTLQLALALCVNYTQRYGREHATQSMLTRGILSRPPAHIPYGQNTPHVLCMPSELHSQDPVHSYRLFYAVRKARFAKWEHSEEPYWWREYLQLAERFKEHEHA